MVKDKHLEIQQTSEYNNNKKVDSQEQTSGHLWGVRGINY